MINLLEDFQNLQSQFPTSGPATAYRREGREMFLEMGMPSRKDEAWHYTSVKGISDKKFQLALLKTPEKLSKKDIRHYSPDFFNLVFVNGRLNRALSDWEVVNKEAVITELGSTVGLKISAVNPGAHFESLNRSYFQQGLNIDIPPETSLSKPIQILNVVTKSGLMTHPYLKIKVNKGSKLSLIESFSSHSADSLQNSVCEVELMGSSSLEYVRLQDEHMGSFNVGLTRFVLRENSSLEALSFTVGSKLGRHDLELVLAGKGADASVNGLILGAGDQHLDHFTLIDHQTGDCTTRQLYKSVLNHRAHSVFTGKVIIRQGSQKASSEQLNKNLLLSKEAEADSRPQLEILADDVQATHGSTVGQLSSEELFYLLSRAISKEQATEMLSLGFIQDLVFRVSNTIIQKWLNGLLIEAYRKGVKS